MLRKQGLTYQAICKQLGCGPNALNQQFKKRAKVIKNFSKNNGLYNSFQRESLFPIESIQHTIFQEQDNRMKNIVLFQVDICVNFYIFSIDGKICEMP